jgi:hypothetical protein
MGYTTEFNGEMTITPALPPRLITFVNALATSRRMKRTLDPIYGTEGEFFVEGGGWAGQDHELTVVDFNNPSRTQPGLWCQWEVNEEGTALFWNGGEKFYEYTAWLAYIQRDILLPLGYCLEGEIEWRGEDWSDTGTIMADVGGVTSTCGDMYRYTPANHTRFLPYAKKFLQLPLTSD